ncbi:hypothetical protein [Dyadobacter sp. BHUBP1]|uniref:hypothetical protein n=1 Tax=Dyadobacter sp. BHUBP1 TaxID=3424178 RepID=UPI003D356BCD
MNDQEKQNHDEAAEMLRQYKERQDSIRGGFKTMMRQYFEAVDEYTAKHGKAPPPVIFNLNGTTVKSDDDFPFRERSRGLER